MTVVALAFMAAVLLWRLDNRVERNRRDLTNLTAAGRQRAALARAGKRR